GQGRCHDGRPRRRRLSRTTSPRHRPPVCGVSGVCPGGLPWGLRRAGRAAPVLVAAGVLPGPPGGHGEPTQSNHPEAPGGWVQRGPLPLVLPPSGAVTRGDFDFPTRQGGNTLQRWGVTARDPPSVTHAVTVVGSASYQLVTPSDRPGFFQTITIFNRGVTGVTLPRDRGSGVGGSGVLHDSPLLLPPTCAVQSGGCYPPPSYRVTILFVVRTSPVVGWPPQLASRDVQGDL